MRHISERLSDIIAGFVTLAVGMFIILEGRTYGVGELRNMGAGYFPVVIGGVLVALSVIMVVTAKPGDELVASSWRQIRGMIFVTAGFLAFALTIEPLGMLAAVTLSVFLSALASKATSSLTALTLAVVTALASVLIFRVGLGLQIQAF